MRTAERIEKARTYACLSKTALAKAVGVTKSAAGQWEADPGTMPTGPHLFSIAETTGVNYAWLAEEKGPMLPAGKDAKGGQKKVAFNGSESMSSYPTARGRERPMRDDEIALLDAVDGLSPDGRLKVLTYALKIKREEDKRNPTERRA